MPKKTTPAKRRPGAETLFKREYVEQARNLCKLGARDEDVAGFFGVSKKTLYTWQERYPELRQSMLVGKELADEYVTRALYHRALGFEHPAVKIFCTKEGEIVKADYIEKVPPETTACIFWLKNRRPDLWRDRIQNEVTGAAGKPLIDLSAFSTEQLQGAIAALVSSGSSGGTPDASG